MNKSKLNAIKKLNRLGNHKKPKISNNFFCEINIWGKNLIKVEGSGKTQKESLQQAMKKLKKFEI